MSLRQPDRRRGGRPWRPVLGILLGLGLIAAVARHVDVRDVARSLATLGTVAPALILMSGLRYGLQAAAWRLAIPVSDRPDWSSALRGVVAGEAVGFLAWGGVVAREPVKVWFVRHRSRTAPALLATLVERAIYAVGALLLAALALLSWLPSYLAGAAGAGAIAGVCLWLTGLRTIGAAAVRHRRRPRTKSEPVKLRASSRRWRRRIDAGLTRIWRQRRATLAAILGLALLQQGLLVAETWLLVDRLRPPASLGTVLSIEGATKLVNTAGAIVPGRLGVAEGGTAALTSGLGLGAGLGVELVLAKRARAVLWSAVGLALLAWHGVTRGWRHASVRQTEASLPTDVIEVQS
ncbi:MAG: lysylphosphatidylglycerol synthase domain-containing protein [Acidobacteriota bacterium]